MDSQIELKVKVSFWVPAFINACRLFSDTFGFKPDIAKMVNFIVRNGVKIQVGHE